MWGELRSLPLLAALTDRELVALSEDADEVSVLPGDPLFPAYAVTDALWVLVEGRWRVVRRVAGADALMFEADRPGTWTGGVPIIDVIAPPRAEVLAPSRFARLPLAAVHAVVATNTDAARRLLEALEWGARTIGGLLGERSHHEET